MGQRPNEIPPIWHRIVVSAALAALMGWLAGRLARPQPKTVGLATGSLIGLLWIRPQKVAYGPLIGSLVGRVLGRYDDRMSPGAVAAATVLVYRITSALLFATPRCRSSPSVRANRTYPSWSRWARGAGM
jgi:hypothetical protein